MASYFEWAKSKLSGAPAGSIAIWIDPSHLLSSRNGGPLADVSDQPIADEFGREWRVVTYRANPFPARQAANSAGSRTIVWALAEPEEQIDLTPFEDLLGRAWSIVEISLDALAQELHPELTLPKGLNSILRGISVDATVLLARLAIEARQSPVSIPSALNTMLSAVTGEERGLDLSGPSATLVSTALLYSAASDGDSLRAVRVALEQNAQRVSHGHLLTILAACDPRDVIITAAIGAFLARLQVNNIGPLLSGEGICPPELRQAFEESRGNWRDLAEPLSERQTERISRRLEAVMDSDLRARVRDLLTSADVSVTQVVTERIAILRLLGCLAGSDEFLRSPIEAAALPLIGGSPTLALLHDLDKLKAAQAAGDIIASFPPPMDANIEGIVTAFASGPAATVELTLARGKQAFRSLKDSFSASSARRLLARIDDAESKINSVLDNWDSVWTACLASDHAESYLSHEWQGWHRAKRAAEMFDANTKTWFLVFDGLRFDLWKMIVQPALEARGWSLRGSDLSFAYLPSITTISRKTVIGGSEDSAKTSEQAAARGLGERARFGTSYSVKTEIGQAEDVPTDAWNVRVFSWPDKFVHADIADMNGIASRFEEWLTQEFAPWLDAAVPPTARLIVTSDHGFIELQPDGAIEVVAESDEERNLPRVLLGAIKVDPTNGLQITRGGKAVTVATSRKWFRSPGGRFWRFAHGGCTLVEAVVPFAEMQAVRAGQAQIAFISLPAGVIEIDEGQEYEVKLDVKVTGGTELFPTITVASNLRQVYRDQFPVGTQRSIQFSILGEEGIQNLNVTVQTGQRRESRSIPVSVRLSRIKRTPLDLDI